MTGQSVEFEKIAKTDSLTKKEVIINYSQNSKIKFGVQAGLNYSNFRGYNIPSAMNQLYSENPALAYLVGINIEYKIKEKFSLKLELNYERKSQKADNIIEFSETGDPNEQSLKYYFSTKRNYDYLVLPILLKYKFTNKKNFCISGGPFIGYLLKSKLTNNLNITGFNFDSIDFTASNKKTDFGISLGLGKEIGLSKNKTVNFEIRENIGLSNTSKVDVWGGGKVKTNSINLLIGFFLN